MIKKLGLLSALALVLASSVALAGTSGPLAAAPNVLITDGAGESFIFPVAGSVPGVNGTHFRSEVTLVNFKNEAQEVLVEFLEQGATVPSAAVRVDLGARRFKFWDDFVATEMARPGKLGTLRFRAVQPGTSVTDTTAQLNGFSRIWTPQPGTNGTSSISMQAIRESDLGSLGNEPAYIIGMRQDAQYRTNVGIVNLEAVDRVFLVEPTASSRTEIPQSFTVTVPALSMQQVRMGDGVFEGVVFKISPTSGGLWSAYAASVDNYSGDGWVSKAEYSRRQ